MHKTYYIETFGCQMNLLDSEYLAGILCKIGLSEAESIKSADVFIFHTCCIRNSAENRIKGRIGETKKLKEKNKDIIIGVTGCMVQQKDVSSDLLKKYPYIDFTLGNSNICEFEQIVLSKLNSKTNNKRNCYEDFCSNDNLSLYNNETPILRNSWPNAWVNIISGCDNFCSYCIVPYVRGREISRLPVDVNREALSLLNLGYKEITLLGQNVNRYAIDLNNGWNFNKLLREISSYDYDYRVRFLTSHPKNFSLELIDTIAENPKICKHVHLPLQSGSDHILKLMNRNYNVSSYMKIVNSLRSKIPNIGITTDIMVGFPGESKANFKDTLKIVQEIGFDNAYMFVFSPRKGTPAAILEQINPIEKKERITELVEIQNKISAVSSQKHLNQVYSVIVESHIANGLYCGRTDFGRLVKFKTDSSLIGNFAKILITETNASSLIGRVLND